MFNVSTLYRQSIKLLHQKPWSDLIGLALSMHILKPYKGIIVQVLTAVILSKIIFSEPNSFMHMFNVSIMGNTLI